MRTRIYVLAVSVTLLYAVLALGSLPLSEGQGEAGAFFAAAKYKTRVSSHTVEVWNFTVHNVNCSGNGEIRPQFFLNFYLDGSLWFDEYNGTTYKTWACDVGKTVSKSYLKDWPEGQPYKHDVRVELFWFCNSTSYSEDTLSFSTSVAVQVSLQHIIPTSYLVVYLIACALLLAYDYVASLSE